MNALMATVLGEKPAVLNLHDDNSIVAAMMELGATRIFRYGLSAQKRNLSRQEQ
jgi:hypothetical protein